MFTSTEPYTSVYLISPARACTTWDKLELLDFARAKRFHPSRLVQLVPPYSNCCCSSDSCCSSCAVSNPLVAALVAAPVASEEPHGFVTQKTCTCDHCGIVIFGFSYLRARARTHTHTHRGYQVCDTHKRIVSGVSGRSNGTESTIFLHTHARARTHILSLTHTHMPACVQAHETVEHRPREIHQRQVVGYIRGLFFLGSRGICTWVRTTRACGQCPACLCCCCCMRVPLSLCPPPPPLPPLAFECLLLYQTPLDFSSNVT